MVTSILYGKDFEDQIKIPVELNLKMLHLRKAYDSMTNNDYDRIIESINLPGVNSLIYNTNINVVKIGSAGVKVLDFLFGGNT